MSEALANEEPMPDVIFEVTKKNLETGMRGYPVGYCVTSMVDPEEGLFYRGLPLKEVYDRGPENMIHFLYTGKLDDEASFKAFKSDLETRAYCSDKAIEHILKLPRDSHPMKLFICALLILGSYDGTGDYREDCLNLIAKLPHLCALLINYHAGWGDTPKPNPTLGYMESFVEMLKVPGADKSRLTELMRLFNVLHYDHGGGNLSCFVGKAVASGLEDMYGSMASAMCALSGPRHGKANQDGLEFVKRAIEALGENPTGEQVEAYVKGLMDNNELIYGFGHAVLRVEDPRATIFYQYGQEHFPDHPLVRMILLLREYGVKALKSNPKISNPYPNVDATSGSVLTAAGFGFPEYFTLLFGQSRIVGIAIQTVYERLEAREGKGLPIVRPKYFYKD
ncbi:MAG: citrate (Si)-synthase [Simkaniaceae bacterium]|nr:citrate (Si)-synthase [Simkaniaceae bacterium]